MVTRLLHAIDEKNLIETLIIHDQYARHKTIGEFVTYMNADDIPNNKNILFGKKLKKLILQN